MKKAFPLFLLIALSALFLSAGGCFLSSAEPVLPNPPFCRQPCEKKIKEYKKQMRVWKAWREKHGRKRD